MKSKSQKRDEAIERNAPNRDKYKQEAIKAGKEGDAVEAFADYKQGVPKSRR